MSFYFVYRTIEAGSKNAVQKKNLRVTPTKNRPGTKGPPSIQTQKLQNPTKVFRVGLSLIWSDLINNGERRKSSS